MPNTSLVKLLLESQGKKLLMTKSFSRNKLDSIVISIIIFKYLFMINIKQKKLDT